MRMLIVTTLLYGLIVVTAGASEKPVIRLAADAWCPYNCDPKADKPGYVIELATEIFGRAGYRVEYLVQPWARTLKSVKRGDVQGAIGASSQELPDAIFPTEEIGQYHGHFIISTALQWQYDSPQSLRGMRLGVINGYDYGSFNDYVEQHRDSEQLLVMSGGDAIHRGLAMLARGRLDAFLEDRDVAAYTIKQMGLERQLIVGDSVGLPIKLHIAFSAQHPLAEHYAQILSEGIRQLRASGKLARILDRYGVVDWSSTAGLN